MSPVLLPSLYSSRQALTSASTVFQTSTIFAGVDTTTVPIPGLAKRATDSAFPTYASACSSFAKYSSACSCLGVTAGTLTLPAAVTITTVTVSVTSATQVVITTVDTTTVPTTVGTSVVTVTTTVSATTPLGEGPFYLQVTGGGTGTLVGDSLSLRVLGPSNFIGSSSLITSALRFVYLPDSGAVEAIDLDNRLLLTGDDYGSYIFVGNDGAVSSLIPLVCTLHSDDTLTCQEGDTNGSLYTSFTFCSSRFGINSPLDVCSDQYNLILTAVAAP